MPVPARDLTPVDTPEAAKKDFFRQLGRSNSDVNRYLNTIFEQRVDPVLNQRNADGYEAKGFSKGEFNSWGIKHNNHDIIFNKQEMASALSEHYTKEMGYEVGFNPSIDEVYIRWGSRRS